MYTLVSINLSVRVYKFLIAQLLTARRENFTEAWENRRRSSMIPCNRKHFDCMWLRWCSLRWGAGPGVTALDENWATRGRHSKLLKQGRKHGLRWDRRIGAGRSPQGKQLPEDLWDSVSKTGKTKAPGSLVQMRNEDRLPGDSNTKNFGYGRKINTKLENLNLPSTLSNHGCVSSLCPWPQLRTLERGSHCVLHFCWRVVQYEGPSLRGPQGTLSHVVQAPCPHHREHLHCPSSGFLKIFFFNLFSGTPGSLIIAFGPP